MHLNKDLYQFFCDKSWDLTEEWFANLDQSESAGVYTSTDPKVIETVKKQNNEFHRKFCEVFNKEEEPFYADFEKWIIEVAQDESHLVTPLHNILREFFRTQEQYLDIIQAFVSEHVGEYSTEEITAWNRIIIKTMSDVITWFTEEYNNHSQKRLQSQQELIMELSTPIISLNEDVALLPLVGDIDTARAKFMLEHTLQQCAQLGVNRLFLDLSGVAIIDTMVAHQLFQLISALKLIGVETILSGLRPEISQTAVQLGLSFENITISSTLSKAIRTLNLSI